MAAGAIITGLAALAAAIGSGISSASATSSAEKMAADERARKEEEDRKRRKKEKFQFSYSALAGQRKGAEDRARRGFFNKQVMQSLQGVRRPQAPGAPKTTTFG